MKTLIRSVAALALIALTLIVGTSTPATASANAAFVGSTAPVRAAAAASSTPAHKSEFAKLWTTVLETPSAQNPFGSGGATYACIDLGNNTVAPLAPSPTGVKSCTVAPGTSIFVTASSVECSTFEGTPKSQLRSCAISGDVHSLPTVTVDGVPVTVSEAETGLLHIVLPANNIFGLPAGTDGYSYAHGWVALVSPLSPGTHKVVITVGSNTITTLIKVKSQ